VALTYWQRSLLIVLHPSVVHAVATVHSKKGSKAISVTGREGTQVCFLRDTNIIYIQKSKVISVTGREGSQLCFLRDTNIIYIQKSKAISVTGREGSQLCFLRDTNIIYIQKSKVVSVTGREGSQVCFLRRFLQEPHGVISQKTPFFIVPAVETSNLTTGTTSAVTGNRHTLRRNTVCVTC
jgi:hypothetical protein